MLSTIRPSAFLWYRPCDNQGLHVEQLHGLLLVTQAITQERQLVTLRIPVRSKYFFMPVQA